MDKPVERAGKALQKNGYGTSYYMILFYMKKTYKFI